MHWLRFFIDNQSGQKCFFGTLCIKKLLQNMVVSAVNHFFDIKLHWKYPRFVFLNTGSEDKRSFFNNSCEH